ELLREHLQVRRQASGVVLLGVQVGGVDEVRREDDQRDDQHECPESQAEVRELVGDGTRIGAHGLTSTPDLKTCSCRLFVMATTVTRWPVGIPGCASARTC